MQNIWRIILHCIYVLIYTKTFQEVRKTQKNIVFEMWKKKKHLLAWVCLDASLFLRPSRVAFSPGDPAGEAMRCATSRGRRCCPPRWKQRATTMARFGGEMWDEAIKAKRKCLFFMRFGLNCTSTWYILISLSYIIIYQYICFALVWNLEGPFGMSFWGLLACKSLNILERKLETKADAKVKAGHKLRHSKGKKGAELKASRHPTGINNKQETPCTPTHWRPL